MEDKRGNWILVIIIIICLGIIGYLLFGGGINYFAFGNNNHNTDQNVEVESIAISESNISLVVGETRRLEAIVLPNNATNKTVTWSSDNPTIVEVNNGVITAKKKGEARVVAKTDNGKEASTMVTVSPKEIKIESMTINKSDIEIVEENSFTLSLTIKPKNNTEKITWTSSDTSVATVKHGVVTAVKTGTALITAKSTSGKMAICDVTVKPKAIQANKITLNKKSETLIVGGSVTLTVTFDPTNTEARTLTWTSSDPTVASVSKGVVKALKAGNTTITAKTSNGKTASATITVKAGVKVVIGTLNIGAYKCGTSSLTCQATYSNFANLIKGNKIDIIGMQEAHPQNTTNKIASSLGYNHYYRQPAAADSTLSKYSFVSKTYYRLPGCYETRELTKVVVTINGVNISFYNTHLSYQSGCPAKQMVEVARIIKEDPNAAILVGDFNVGPNTVLVDALGSKYEIIAHDTSRKIYADSVIIKPKDNAGNLRIKGVSGETVVTRGIYTDHNLVIGTVEIIK